MNEGIADSELKTKKTCALVVLSVLALGSGILEYAIQLYGWNWLWLDFAVRVPTMLGVGFSIAAWCLFDGRLRGIEVSAFTFIAMGIIGIISIPHYLWLRSDGSFAKFSKTGFGLGFWIYSALLYVVGMYGFYGILLLIDAITPQ